MQTVSTVPLQLAVDVKAVSDEESDDIIVTRLSGQQESRVGHP